METAPAQPALTGVMTARAAAPRSSMAMRCLPEGRPVRCGNCRASLDASRHLLSVHCCRCWSRDSAPGFTITCVEYSVQTFLGQASRSRSRQQTARADSESRVPQTTATAAEPEHTISISDNSDAEAPAPAQKRRAAAARSAARSKSIVVSDGDSAPQDEGVQSDMKSEGTEKPAAAKPKRQRAAATLVRKRKAAVSSEDSEGSEEHGEASDPMSEDDVDDSDYAE